MLARLMTNPLLIRAAYRPAKLSIGSGLRFGFATSWIASGLGFFLFIALSDSSPIRLFLGLFSILILAIPPFLAYSAAAITANARRSTPLDMLYVTAISDQRLIEGYTLISLYRFKGYLALLVGFTPLVLLWVTAISVFDCQFPYFCSSAPSPLLFVTMLAGLIVYAFNVLGICLFMTAAGIFLAVAIGNRMLSSWSALLLGLGMTPLMVWAASGGELLSRNLLLLPITYGLFGVLIGLARLLVRKAD